jgi:hypothetical protein
MTDEQMWLLVFGRDWHTVETVEDSEALLPAFKRLGAAGELQWNPVTMYVRLRPKEENEFIRI